MFSNPIIQSTFTELKGNPFRNLKGFGIYSSSNTTYYYVMDYWDDKVYILNDYWSFISIKVFHGPHSMISMDNSLYITGYYNIWKLDQDLNILIQYNSTGGSPYYRGISYNPSNGFICVVAQGLNEILVFKLNFFLICRISTSPCPNLIVISR